VKKEIWKTEWKKVPKWVDEEVPIWIDVPVHDVKIVKKKVIVENKVPAWKTEKVIEKTDSNL
jgi:hypothetical protein